LRSRVPHFLDVPTSEQVLAYVRPAASPRDDIVVLLNFGAEAAQIPHDRLIAASGSGHLVDLLSGRSVAHG
jgi:hypothetical protein